MGEQKQQKQQQQKKKKKNDGESSKDAGKKEETPSSTTVVLKMDMHCEGCASKIVRCLRGFQGVESVKAESEVGNITITGKLDPSKVRDKLAEKMKKKVDLISPHPNKDNNNNNKPDNSNNKKPKEKEAPMTTVVLKVALHCQGCIEKIRKTVFKIKGVNEVAIDKEKETVTVKGTMDAKALVGNLMRRLKRKVEVVPPKKDKDNKDNKDNDADKEKEGAPDKGGSGAAKNKKKGGGGGGGGGDNGEGGGEGEGKMKQTKMESPAPPPMPYGYSYGYNYGPLYMGQVHAPQIFSDENPNACSVM